MARAHDPKQAARAAGLRYVSDEQLKGITRHGAPGRFHYKAPGGKAVRDRAALKRIRALVGWSGCYSILDDLYDFCGHLQPTCQRLLGGVSHDEARKRLAAFTMEGIAQNITCPTLISHGDKDTLMSVAGARRLFEEIGATDKTLRIYDENDDGGRIHCSHDYWGHNVPFMADWLVSRLAPR